MTVKLNKLLEWKSIASVQLKILLERCQKSVSSDENALIKADLEVYVEKFGNSKVREAELTVQLSKMQSAERLLEEEARHAKMAKDELAATELEVEVLSLRLSCIDPVYKKFTIIFK